MAKEHRIPLRMNGKADKACPEQSRRVRFEIEDGKTFLGLRRQPAARVFSTTPKTVRKWLGRYQQECLAGLNELPSLAVLNALRQVFCKIRLLDKVSQLSQLLHKFLSTPG